jgi:hypothetical protein
MTVQLTLEPQRDSSPAKRAADRLMVLAWFAEHTGTAHEAAKGLEMLPTTVLPRVTELRKAGYLTRIPGLRRPTGLGGTAAVLIVTLKGKAELGLGVAA